jgi:hypothetical protein
MGEQRRAVFKRVRPRLAVLTPLLLLGTFLPPHDLDEPLRLIPATAAAIAFETRNAPLAERMGAISEVFLGLPYEDGLLGEGRPPDMDPPARYDSFDCVTLLEEVLALAIAPHPASAPDFRSAFRYQYGLASYRTRNHFFSTQWILHNLQNGLLVDTTERYGEARWIERELTDNTWRYWSGREQFDLTDHELPHGLYSFPILDLETAKSVVEQIRPGTIIVTVREPRSSVPIVVTHVGFTIPADSPTVRHATKMGIGRVRDHSLSWYFEHLETYTNWPVAGVALLEPVEQGPRLASLK